MKKIYKKPIQRVVDLGCESMLLDGSNNDGVNGNVPSGGGLEGSGSSQGDGEDMGVKAQAIWEEW